MVGYSTINAINLHRLPTPHTHKLYRFLWTKSDRTSDIFTFIGIGKDWEESLSILDNVADKLFKEDIYSIWRVHSDEEFYGIIASLSSDRNPREQNIDFICITDEDLETLKISKEQTQEDNCLFVQHLHYNTQIDRTTAKQLCRKLINEGREPKRCYKKWTQAILEHQHQKGCQAIVSNENPCSCGENLKKLQNPLKQWLLSQISFFGNFFKKMFPILT